MLTIALWLGCSGDPVVEDVAPLAQGSVQLDLPRHVSLFGTIPEHMHEAAVPDPALVDLGHMLYFDARLSADQSVSCNTCHPVDRYGAANAPTSGPAADPRPARNAPSTYNAALQFRQYWDGRETELEGAARAAFTNPQQMGMESQAKVLAAINAIPGYREAFAAAFPGDKAPIRYGTLGQALGAYLRTLTTPGSKLDRYQSGDLKALNAEELDGFEQFVSNGCVSCHSGPLFGGGMLQRLGAVHPYDTPDAGIGATSGKEADARLFKVPSLRNVTKTGPWLHDGSMTELDEVVRVMGHHQLGRELSDNQVSAIVAFLDTLTGDLPDDAGTIPMLP